MLVYTHINPYRINQDTGESHRCLVATFDTHSIITACGFVVGKAELKHIDSLSCPECQVQARKLRLRREDK